MVGYKTNFNKFNRTETIQSIFSGHNRIEISERKKSGKSPNNSKLNNAHLDNPWIKEEITREIGKYF